MKNRYMRGAHLKERKFKAILRGFCSDIEAIKIAELNNINRNTAHALFNKFRRRIYELALDEYPNDIMQAQVDESWFGKTRRRKDWFGNPTIVFGLITNEGKVYTKTIKKVSKEEIYPFICALCAPGATILSDAAPVYKGLTGLGYKHLSVNHSSYEFSRMDNDMNVNTNKIESYWSWAKLRLGKFKGLLEDSYEIHLKECEWRFNHRQHDIYMFLLGSFRAYPI